MQEYLEQSVRGEQKSESDSSDEDIQVFKDSELFIALRNNLSEKDIQKCLDNGVKINATNQRGKTVLHIAVEKNNQDMVKFLLTKGEKVNIKNNDQKTPLDLAESNQHLLQILSKSINVPGDGNCLFWAVTLAYLTPVKNDDELFQERFNKLFGSEKLQYLSEVQKLIHNYNPFIKQEKSLDDKTLKELVTKQFRWKIVDYMRSNSIVFKGSVAGSFEKYLRQMSIPGEWGGEHEIQAMSKMLGCVIEVYSASTSIYNKGPDDLIKLYHEDLTGDTSSSSNRNHYNFGVDLNIVDDAPRPVSPHARSKDQLIDWSGQQETSSKRQSTDNDQDGTPNKKIKSDIRKRPHNNENPNYNKDGVSSEKRPKFSSDKPYHDNDIVSTSHKKWLDKSEILSEGSKLAQHGNIFQLKLLMLFLYRAKESDYTAFRLATELSEAEKFDDVAFQYKQKNGETWKFRLLQAKHKEGTTVEAELPKIKKAELLSSDDNEAFSLQKYFRSYLQIKQRSKESSIYSVFSKSEIEDIIVITNTDFDSDRLKNYFKVDDKKDIEEDELLKVPTGHKTLIYKLKDQENNEIVRQLKPIFENTSDFYKLVEELAEHILTEKQIDKTGLFQDYYYPLISEVLIIEKEEGKNELPSDDFQLKELAKKLADYAEQKKELTVSDFKDYHIALATEVINPKTKKCFTHFKKGTKFIELFKTEISKIKKVKAKSKQLALIEFKLSPDFGKSEYYPLSKFSKDNLSEEAEQFREALIKEITFIQNNQELITISEEFGKNELPTDDSQLKELAKKLANCAEQKQQLTVSDFEDYHVALTTEVINPETKKIRSNFINPEKDANNKKKLRDFLKREIASIRKVKAIINDDLKLIEFTLSPAFGKSELPYHKEKLTKLAEKLANCVEQKQELTVSDFKDYHIALATEVIDINTKKFQEIFVYGKVKEGNNIHKQLSTLSKQFRRILLDKMVNDEQEQNTKDSLKKKNIKFSEGFKKAFTPEKNPIIAEVQEFVQQKIKLLSKGINKKIVEINENSVTKEKFNTFEANIKKLAGYVLIEKFNKVRFSTSFLRSDELPGNLKNFRNELKKLLGQEKFESIYEYVFDIKVKGFKTCEEGALDRKLPILHEVADVTDFFQKLKFVVNYPNRIGVNDLLENEIQNKLKKLDSKAFNSLYQEDLHKWMADRVGTFYTVDKANTLFNEIKNNLLLWTMDGVNKPYFADGFIKYKFNEYNILTKFLENKQQVLPLVFQDLQLGRIRIVQTFRNLQKREYNNIQQYTRGFGHIFLYLEQLLNNDFRTEVLKYFQDSKQLNLIVIECDTQQEIQGLDDTSSFYDMLSEVFLKSSSNTNNNKKIILITKKNDALANKFATDPQYKSEKDTTSFIDLIQLSQDQLLKKEVTFQGYKISLNKLIDQKDENAKQIIDSETLVKLIKGDEVTIGSNLKDLGEIHDYYIPRMFNRQVTLNKEKIQRSSLTDLFVINDTDRGYNNKMYVFDKNNDELAGSKFRELCKQNTGSNIHWLKSESGKLILHKSKGSISNLVKYREIDKVDTTDNKTSNTDLPENKYLEENTSKIVIIVDTAGMGKSTVLTSLSMQIKQNNPSQWVIRIDLNDYTTVLKQELAKRKSNKQNQDANKVVNLLESQESTKLTTKLEKDLFNSSVNGQGKIALLFDGFDEISPDYQDVVIDILQALKNSKVDKLFVTSRPNMRELLEERLEVFSHVLEPFNAQDQIKFFTEFWTNKLELKDLNQERKERLNTYAESLIKKFSTQINDREQKFIGIPLQTMMLAEIFEENKEGLTKEWEGCKEFLTADHTHTNPKLPEKFDLIGLYENFVKRKYHDFFLKKRRLIDDTKPNIGELADEIYENFKKRHETLALAGFFSDEVLKTLLSKTKIQQLNDWIQQIKNNEGKNFEKNKGKNFERNEGIVYKIIDNKPHFIHRTFAEYFAADFLASKLAKNENIQEFLCAAVDSLVANASPVFISSIAKILNKKKVRVESYTVLDFITRNKLNYLKFFNALLEIDNQDDLGKTSLHYAVQHNYADTTEYILNYKKDILEEVIFKHGSFKKPEYENSNLVKFVNKQDNICNTALVYAEDSDRGNMLALKLLLNGANIDKLTKECLKLIKYMLVSVTYLNGDRNRRCIFNSNVLSATADQDNKFRPIQEKLLLKAPDAVSHLHPNDDYPMLLSYFFKHARVKVIATLLKSLNDKEKRKRLLNFPWGNATPLDRVIGSDQISDNERFNITKYLLKHGGTETMSIRYSPILSNTRYITKILQAAAQHGHIRTFKHFLHKEHRKFYYIHLHRAAISQQFNIIKYLIKNHRKNLKHQGMTALHNVLNNSQPNLKIIKFLIDNGENVNAQNYEGETPLFMAIHADHGLNVIKYLVDHKSNVNIADKQDHTVLYHAVERDQIDVVKYLLKNSAIISDNAPQFIKDKVAFFRDPIEFDLNLIDQDGSSRLHTAIKSNNLKWSEFIIRQGGNVNIEDQEGKTPLHVAFQFSELEIVKLLFQYGAMYDKADKLNNTPITFCNYKKVSSILEELDNCFKRQHLDTIVDRIDAQFTMLLNARNHEGKSLIHIAAETNNIRALRRLLELQKDVMEYPVYKDNQSISINAIDSQGNTPLHFAAQKGHNQMVSSLLKEGAIFNAKNKQGKTPIELARKDDVTKLLSAVKILFDAAEEGELVTQIQYINVKNEDAKTLLHIAVLSDKSNVDIIKLLLQHDSIDINSPDINGNTPLHLTVTIDFAKYLLRKGVIYNSKNKQEKTPKDHTNNQEISSLIESIDKIFNDIQSDNPNVIISNPHIQDIVNVRDSHGNTILHYATNYCYIDIVKHLLKKGAIYNIKNKQGKTPKPKYRTNHEISSLFESIDEMFNDINSIFNTKQEVDMQIITNVRNDQGRTLLHKAAVSGKLDIVKLLVDHGANAKAQDILGKSVLHVADLHGYQDIVALLEGCEH